MNKINERFNKLTNIKPRFSSKINKGITNNNYMVYCKSGRYVFRVPRDNMFGIDFANQNEVLNVVKNINVDVVSYDNTSGMLVTKYVKKSNKKVSIEEVSDLLHKLHKTKGDNIKEFNPFTLLKTYKEIVKETIFENEETIIKKAKGLYLKYPRVLSHNDVLLDNFIKTDKKVYLIDYEYSGMNNLLFDIGSFISENNLNELDKEKFISCYFNDVTSELKSDIDDMINFEDILWSYWAKAMYIKYNEKVFLDIYQIKTTRQS